jgi:hypothetical protein
MIIGASLERGLYEIVYNFEREKIKQKILAIRRNDDPFLFPPHRY